MAPLLSRSLPPLLVAVHVVLLVWAVVGLVEWCSPTVPWPRVSNLLFPRWLLLWHWLAVLLAAVIFLVGFFARWTFTPKAMVAAYSLMALVCVVETFWFLTHPWRFAAMALEFLAYVAISLALHRMPRLTARFAGKNS
ncbi:hypothetical protein [Piscinibacter sp.]|uniref:hypothetical protein n=1 Tax=Piscinibacter sp. TaxID=1903157 RepID=UPI002CE02111|nr:hypothetical protein [Albitalea sp.]HUG22644.1 hypothetical protein [Albitalea sp.]